LRNPRSFGWNVELDRQLTSSLVVRAGFQQRNTARDFVLDPQANLGLMSLSSTGRSFIESSNSQPNTRSNAER
jgi:hypothetical protein